MTSALDIAQYFINHSYGGQLDDVTNLKLQKLLYYAQGYSLAIYDEPLFDEDIVNWSHGTVVPCVYYEFRSFKDQIIQPILSFDIGKFPKQAIAVLELVCRDYAKFSAWKLREMTHNESPWNDTKRNEVITKDSIKKFFKEKLNCEKFDFDLHCMEQMLDTEFVEIPNDISTLSEFDKWLAEG